MRQSGAHRGWASPKEEEANEKNTRANLHVSRSIMQSHGPVLSIPSKLLMTEDTISYINKMLSQGYRIAYICTRVHVYSYVGAVLVHAHEDANSDTYCNRFSNIVSTKWRVLTILWFFRFVESNLYVLGGRRRSWNMEKFMKSSRLSVNVENLNSLA